MVEVCIQTEDDDFLVERNDLGDELFDSLDRDVEVTGIVTEDRDGTMRITVTNYEVVNEGDDDADEDFGDKDDGELDFGYRELG